MPQVGRGIPRLEAHAKVTGRAEYMHGLRIAGMLHGKIFRSTVPHGRIKRIDTRAAQQLPGVHRVITGEDIRALIPEPYYGPAFHDQPILALDKVRYVGEPVAVVLASDPHVAERGAELIEADYDELPAVYDEIAALSAGRHRPRRAQARRHVPGPQAPGRPHQHQCGARLPFAPRRARDRDGVGRSRARAHVQDPAGRAPAARAVRLGRRAERRRHRHPYRRRRCRRSCASRSRACSAGRRRACA